MTRLYAFLALIAVAAIGWINIRSALSQVKEKRRFALEFLNKLQSFTLALPARFDSETYAWLTSRSVKMQSELGGLGRAHYRPAYSGYIIENYPLIINTLPEIRSGTAHPNQIAACEEAIIRLVGIIDDDLESVLEELRNPLIWFREGVQWLLALPLSLLHWLGALTESSVSRLSSSSLFRLTGALLAVMGFLSSVVTVALGWEQTKEITIRILERVQP